MRCGVYVRVSTDDQRDNGYFIDSQLRMIKEYCEKNEYDIVDVYNDAGHSGKDLMRPEMQRLLKDIKSKKIDKLVAIKVDRLTRNNYDGFWLLNYCEEHDVKIELILEPYDVYIANGEMIFGMNLVFGQRERKEIDKLIKKKTTLNPDNDFKEYTVELLKKLDYEEDNGDIIFKNNLSFAYLFDSLNRKTQKELINRLISSIEITRDDNYNIEIKNIKFTEEFISKSTKDYIDYLNELLTDNNIGITFKEQINKEKLLELENDYIIMSLVKMKNNQYTEEELNNYFDLMKEHFYVDGIINCPYIEDNNIVDTLILIPKTELINI